MGVSCDRSTASGFLARTQAAAAQAVTLKYGQAYSALRSIFALPLLVAEREGFFAREGLNFVTVPIPGGGEKLIEALHDGTADMSHVATPFLIQAAMKGSDAVAIATEFNNPIYSLIAKPEIKTYADLKGKLLGIAAETGSITISIRKLLAMHGLQRERLSSRSSWTARPTACLPDRRRLRRGAARAAAGFRGHAARLSAARPLDRGGARIRLHGDGGAPLLGEREQGHGRALRARARARRSASSAIPARRNDVVRTIVETTGFAEANARLTLSLYFEPERKVLPLHGEIDPKGPRSRDRLHGRGRHPEGAAAAPERFVDLQYLQAAGLQ